MSDLRATRQDVEDAEALFRNWIGFEFHGGVPRRLRDFLESRATRLDYPSVASYIADLPARRPRTEEAQRLVNIVTNGLTAFWRDDKQMEALGIAMREMAAKREEPLAIWCAGCATGEEAYSVAMLARELDIDVQVVGTDVNTTFLDAARRAEFDDWSLRRLVTPRRNRWFEFRDERWILDPSIRSVVTFEHHNLLDLPPQAPNEYGEWDIVMCRNVVIYFTASVVSSLFVRFAAVLADDGYLLLGSSEQIDPNDVAFRAVRHGPSFIYRPQRLAPGDSIPFLFGDDSEVEPTLDEVTKEVSDSDAAGLLLVSGVENAERGRIDAAVACFEAAASYDPFATEVHALLACTLRDAGARGRALDALGKVLFLDPLNWWAAIQRARLYEKTGDLVEARRHWRRALEGLDVDYEPFEGPRAAGELQGVHETTAEARRECEAALQRLSPSV